MAADLHPVYRHIGPDREAALAFVSEAAARGYRAVRVCPSIAAAFGAPTSAAIPVLSDEFLHHGYALAVPPRPLVLTEAKESFDAR